MACLGLSYTLIFLVTFFPPRDMFYANIKNVKVNNEKIHRKEKSHRPSSHERCLSGGTWLVRSFIRESAGDQSPGSWDRWVGDGCSTCDRNVAPAERG